MINIDNVFGFFLGCMIATIAWCVIAIAAERPCSHFAVVEAIECETFKPGGECATWHPIGPRMVCTER